MVLLAFAETVQLLPDLTMFIHIALILTMIWLLNRTFFKPINRILEARERNRGGGPTEAERILNEVADKDAEYSSALLDARNEGYEFIERERREAVGEKASAITSVKQEVAEYLEGELSTLEKQEADAEAEIRVEAEKMADKISANILRAV